MRPGHLVPHLHHQNCLHAHLHVLLSLVLKDVQYCHDVHLLILLYLVLEGIQQPLNAHHFYLQAENQCAAPPIPGIDPPLASIAPLIDHLLLRRFV